jgi:hypothetical protein
MPDATHYTYRVAWSVEDGEHVATVAEFPSLSWLAATPVEALAGLYDRRTALAMTIAELAMRAGMTVDEVECVEEGGTEPTVALLRRLAAALDADVRLTPGHDLGSVGFETHAA